MSHRVHPKAYRLRETSNWDSRWQNKKKIPQYLKEDFLIRSFLEKKLKDSGVDRIEIERFPGRVNIIITTSKPGFIIGRGGKGVEEIKRELEKRIIKEFKPLPEERREMKIDIKEIRNPWIYSSIVGQWVAQQIEKRMPYRRVLKQALSKASANKEVQGIRIQVSGRLNGTQIARREWLQNGHLPRQTLRADIDYTLTMANCTYGVIGVKVWIYKGEKF